MRSVLGGRFSHRSQHFDDLAAMQSCVVHHVTQQSPTHEMENPSVSHLAASRICSSGAVAITLVSHIWSSGGSALAYNRPLQNSSAAYICCSVEMTFLMGVVEIAVHLFGG
jgi:hypothetical protein